MKVAVLGSGSRGNAAVFATDRTTILVDAGLSGRQIAERLLTLGIHPGSIAGIVVTHEHADHTRGMGVFSRRFGTPLHLTASTAATCESWLGDVERVSTYQPGRTFEIGDVRVHPYLSVHDAADSVALAIEGTTCGTRVGVATDLGRPTVGVRHALSGCHFLVLEANHDETLLRTGPYPASVQARIASSHGHLSNAAAADLARELLHPGLVGIFLAHLSQECNRPDLAKRVVERALQRAGWRGLLEVADQDRPTALVDVAALRADRGRGQLELF